MGRYRPERSSGSSCLTFAAVGCGVLVLGVVALCGMGMVFGLIGREEAKKELAEADRLWDAGQKPEAVGRYRSLLLADQVTDRGREPLLYQRVAEYDVEHADTTSARTLIEHAVGRQVDVPSQNEAVAKLVAEAKAERERKAEGQRQAEAKRKEEERAAGQKRAEEEYDADGLVLLRKTVSGRVTGLGMEITGTVENRRGRKLGYAQIQFNVYDKDGAQVGTALANVNGLEPGGRWSFKAVGFATGAATYKFSELSGF